MKMPRNTLIIMTRRPRWGLGKERLAASLGPGAAWHFQRFALEALVRRLGRDRRWHLEVAVTPDGATRGSGRWVGGHPRYPQGSGDLGERMLLQLEGKGTPPGPRLVVGADIPGVVPPLIALGFRLLKTHDWVLGPALDGGFWAIGSRRHPWRPPDLAGIAWGSAEALIQTRGRLKGTLAFLPFLADVDEAESLRLWRRSFQGKIGGAARSRNLSALPGASSFIAPE